MIKLNFRAWLILILLLSGCAEEQTIRTSNPVIVPPRKPAQSPKTSPSTSISNRDVFIVKKGDTLYSIGFGSGIGYEQLSEWNDIPKPYKLHVGQIIKLYDPALSEGDPVESADTSTSARTIQSSKIITPPPAGIQSINKPIKNNTRVVATPPSPPHTPKLTVITARKPPVTTTETSADSKDKEKSLKLYWKWPIQGKILKSFVQSGNKGIDIEAKAGDLVRASANGEVVYSGNGLIGYGNLLIIKHDDLHLSAYANNASLQVNEGQKVTQGQAIARCGKSASGVPSLHFEIRKNGKSVNPLLYLPAQ